MRLKHLAWGLRALGVALTLVVLSTGAVRGADTAPPLSPTPTADNTSCLSCHDASSHKLETPGVDGKPRALLAIAAEKFGQGVHAKLACVSCHSAIKDSPAPGASHQRVAGQPVKSADCASCHEQLWKSAQADGSAAARPRLGVVASNVEAYRKSFHARPHKSDKSRVNASCDACHDTHSFNIPAAGSPQHAAWRLNSPAMCGTKCHSDELEEYSSSIHGKAALEKKDAKAAVCSDCHSAHDIGNTSAPKVKLAITANCGGCHAENYKSYKATYHGQISSLGYAHTAKCFDCHGSHAILAVKDKESKVHPDKRMETCKSCHNGKKGIAEAPAGFATFQPHGTTNNFARYPQMWVAWQIMLQLLVGTFGFFWLHTLLWFYREWKDRKNAVPRPHVNFASLPAEFKGKHFQRFSRTWRLAHISFALSLMILTLTGMPLFYPDVAWAPLVMKALGGPHVAGLIHRVNAVIFAGVFFWHLGYMALLIWRKRATWKWFGPDSMIPNLQDGKDMLAMFRWFFGRGPRPVFDRWTYWEKFDYWAPFWGVTIIGVSGLVMWLPNAFGAVLPGWVFNVAAIFHGEEAFLAVVFLFTVHFFNNHFRPDKFPVDVVMFTGSMSLEHFKREHANQYQRLSASGELARHLVDAPSAPLNLGAKLLGFTLIALGLTLLTGVAIGFFTGTGA
jgi:cytochrome b subunit of formate dehydrogenase/cytochrome c5